MLTSVGGSSGRSDRIELWPRLPLELLEYIFDYAVNFPGFLDHTPISAIERTLWNLGRQSSERNRSRRQQTRWHTILTLSLVCKRFKRISDQFIFQQIYAIDLPPASFDPFTLLEKLATTIEQPLAASKGTRGLWTKRLHLDFDLHEEHADITPLLLRIFCACPNLTTFITLGSIDDCVHGSSHLMTSLYELCPKVTRVERAESVICSVGCLRSQMRFATRLQTLSLGTSAFAESDGAPLDKTTHRPLILLELRVLELEDEIFLREAVDWVMPKLAHVTLRFAVGESPITALSDLRGFFRSHGPTIDRLELLEDRGADQAALDLDVILDNCPKLGELVVSFQDAMSISHPTFSTKLVRLGIIGLECSWPFIGESLQDLCDRSQALMAALPDLELIRTLDGSEKPQVLKAFILCAAKKVRVENSRRQLLKVENGLVIAETDI